MSTSDTHVDIVRALMTALEANDREGAERYLAETFTFSGWTPKPLDRKSFLNVVGEIKEGIPGLLFNLHNVLEADKTTVTGTMQVAGYQSDSFIVPELSTPPIPQTGNSVSLPAENVRFGFDGDRVTTMAVEHVAGGGIKGLLHQLGIELSVIQ